MPEQKLNPKSSFQSNCNSHDERVGQAYNDPSQALAQDPLEEGSTRQEGNLRTRRGVHPLQIKTRR